VADAVDGDCECGREWVGYVEVSAVEGLGARAAWSLGAMVDVRSANVTQFDCSMGRAEHGRRVYLQPRSLKMSKAYARRDAE
jgi:hypothetical protein